MKEKRCRYLENITTQADRDAYRKFKNDAYQKSALSPKTKSMIRSGIRGK
ncbi:MAG: hypothetical protein H2212_12835 [Ruminococcus sp.]|nr:hypothetical protein [Ruminococcus sp.]